MTLQIHHNLSNERLVLLYEVFQTFYSSLDLDQVLNNVIEKILHITQAERGFVILIKENGELGLFPDTEYNIVQIDFDPGDTLLVFTDGVTDGFNPTGKTFGEERVFSLVCQPAPSLNDSLEKIKIALVEREQFGDITLMAIKREQKSLWLANGSF